MALGKGVEEALRYWFPSDSCVVAETQNQAGFTTPCQSCTAGVCRVHIHQMVVSYCSENKVASLLSEYARLQLDTALALCLLQRRKLHFECFVFRRLFYDYLLGSVPKTDYDTLPSLGPVDFANGHWCQHWFLYGAIYSSLWADRTSMGKQRDDCHLQRFHVLPQFCYVCCPRRNCSECILFTDHSLQHKKCPM